MLNRNVVLSSLVFALALAGSTRAQKTERAADRFTFKAGQADEQLDLVISRWSTDRERDAIFTAAQKDLSKTLTALDNPGVVGYIHLPGGLDHTIRYARRITRPDGSVDIVALAEGAVWVWWQPAASDASSKYGFTAIQLHLGAGATGEGKLSAAKVAADKDAGITIADYANEPVLLKDVKRDLAS